MLNFLLFVGCYVGGFIMAFFANPAWAFMLYQVVYFMSPLERWWSYMIPTLSYSFFTVVLMFAVFLKNYSEHQKNRLLKAPQFKWVYFIAILYVFTLGYASIPDINKDATINFIKLAIIISIAYKLVDTREKLDGALWAFMAGAAYIGFLTFQVGRGPDGRVEGIGTVDAADSNGIAAAIAPGVVLCTYYFWNSKKKLVKFGAALFGAFIANGIVLINSRGSFLAVLVSMAYFFMILYFSKHQRKHQKASVIGLTLFALAGAVFVVDETAVERFKTMKQEGMTEEQETGATRVFFWLAAIDMAKDHPFGTGARGFEAHAPDYLPLDMDTGPHRNRSVHSSWFEALTEIGYLGFACLIGLLYACFKCTRRCKAHLSASGQIDDYYKVVAIEAAFIAFIVAMSFMNRFRAEILYWCVLFTACAYNIYILKLESVESAVKRKRG